MNGVYFTYFWTVGCISVGFAARGGCVPVRAATSHSPRHMWGARVPVLLFTSYSPLSTKALRRPPPLGALSHPGALFAASTVCSGSRNRSGAERVQRRWQRLALLACPFRVNKTSPNVASYSSRRSCLWKTRWIHYLPLFPAWNEGCVYRYQHRIFQFGCESWRQKFSSVFL